MQKTMTYYAQTPAIDSLCAKYGSFWQGLSTIERLHIASAIAESLMHIETDLLNTLMKDCSIDVIVANRGFEFEDNTEVIQLLKQLDAELDPPKSANLLIGIYSNITF